MATWRTVLGSIALSQSFSELHTLRVSLSASLDGLQCSAILNRQHAGSDTPSLSGHDLSLLASMFDMTGSSAAEEFAGSLTRPPWSYKLWMLAGSRERFFDRLIRDYGDFVQYRGSTSTWSITRPW